jgi:hypothetical protein
MFVNKKPLVFLACLMVILGLAGLTVAAEWPAGLAEEKIINDPVYEGQHKKGPVKFPHKKHFVEKNVQCDQCHHDFQDGKNVWQPADPVKTCGSCHKYEETEGKMFKMKMGTAFHNLCRTCHTKNGKGPKNCDQCHQPKS